MIAVPSLYVLDRPDLWKETLLWQSQGSPGSESLDHGKRHHHHLQELRSKEVPGILHKAGGGRLRSEVRRLTGPISWQVLLIALIHHSSRLRFRNHYTVAPQIETCETVFYKPDMSTGTFTHSACGGSDPVAGSELFPPGNTLNSMTGPCRPVRRKDSGLPQTHVGRTRFFLFFRGPLVTPSILPPPRSP